jgi:hypothetical protein
MNGHIEFGTSAFQLFWGVVGTPDLNQDHNCTENITANKTFRITGINFFKFVTAVKNHELFHIQVP